MELTRHPLVLGARRRTFGVAKELIRTRNDRLSLAVRARMGQPWVRLGRVSVIVPIYNVEEYLEECLESIRLQSYPDLEVLLIDDGSTDGSRAIAKRYAQRDHRFTLITKTNAGLGAARNTGVQRATGEYLAFVDSDDEIPRDAYQRMVQLLASSGSEFVVGGIERWVGRSRWRDDWVTRVHGRTRVGLTLDDLPEATKDVFACNKLYRADFFAQVIGSFPVGVLHEDQVPAARAYTGCAAFDVLADTTYFWRIREDGSSITQARLAQRNLDDRILVAEQVERIYAAGASARVRRSRWQDFVGDDLAQYYRHAHLSDDAYWARLVAFVRGLFARLPEDLWAGVAVRERMLAYAVSVGDRALLARLVAVQESHPAGVPVIVRDGAVASDAAVLAQPEVDVAALLGAVGDAETDADADARSGDHAWPANIVRLGAVDTSLRTGLTRVAWHEDGSLSVHGFAYRDNLPLTIAGSDLGFAVVTRTNGDEIELPIEVERFAFAADDPSLPRSSYLDYAEAGFRATVPADVIARHSTLAVRATLAAAGGVVTALLVPQDSENTPALVPRVAADGRARLVRGDRLDGLRVRLGEPGLATSGLNIAGRTVRLTVVADRAREASTLHARNRSTGMHVRVPIPTLAAGASAQLELTLPQPLDVHATLTHTIWALDAEEAEGSETLSFASDARPERLRAERGALAPVGGENGELTLSDALWTATVESIIGTENGIEVRGHWASADVVPARMLLVAVDNGEPRFATSFEVTEHTDGARFIAEFALAAEECLVALGGDDDREPLAHRVAPRLFGLCLMAEGQDDPFLSSRMIYFDDRSANGVRELIAMPGGHLEVTDFGANRSVLLRGVVPADV